MVKNVGTAEILYYLAEDFVKLTFPQKFRIGMKLGLIRPEDVNLSDDEIDHIIFIGMYKKNKFEEFTTCVYNALWER